MEGKKEKENWKLIEIKLSSKKKNYFVKQTCYYSEKIFEKIERNAAESCLKCFWIRFFVKKWKDQQIQKTSRWQLQCHRDKRKNASKIQSWFQIQNFCKTKWKTQKFARKTAWNIVEIWNDSKKNILESAKLKERKIESEKSFQAECKQLNEMKRLKHHKINYIKTNC